MQRFADLALRDLRRYQQLDPATIAALRATSYTEEQILSDWFPEERRTAGDPDDVIGGDISRAACLSSKWRGRQSPQSEHSMIDPFGRAITYLRVSVTDRCDFRCVYCMAENMTFSAQGRAADPRRARPACARPSSRAACASCG